MKIGAIQSGGMSEEAQSALRWTGMAGGAYGAGPAAGTGYSSGTAARQTADTAQSSTIAAQGAVGTAAPPPTGTAAPPSLTIGTGTSEASADALPPLPTGADLLDARETLARMGIAYPGMGIGDEGEIPIVLPGKTSDADVAELAGLPGARERECRTCAERKYQDGSNDMGVSFKVPTHLSPSRAASAVMSHEMEHVSHERANALEKGGKVLSQSVTIHTDVCPECGRFYVSGGVTRTTVQTPVETPVENKDGVQAA